MKKRILFINENDNTPIEPSRLGAGFDPEWELEETSSEGNILGALEDDAFDAVVFDAPLTNQQCKALLRDVANLHPKMLRFVVSDFGDGKALMNAVGAAHHCVPKPIKGELLSDLLKRAFELENWLTNETVKKLLNKMTKLPSPPTLYFKVVQLIQSPDAAIDDVAKLIAQDVAITAKLLHLVNSAAFGLQRKVTSAEEAIMFLGMDITKSLVLLAHTFSYFDQMNAAGFSMEKVWEHSLTTGSYAKAIAKAQGCSRKMCEEAFTAGLLHDIGKLLFAANIAEQYADVIKEARSGSESLWKTELGMIGASHADLGAGILAIWGLPISIIEAVALHHTPTVFSSKEFSPLVAVHVANNLAHLDLLTGNGQLETSVDLQYLEAVGLGDQLGSWIEACREVAASSLAA